jgi:5-methylcytosine-specific restriction endonuclease McrA
MNYKELLLTLEWKSKRAEIINRDDLKCSNCNNLELIKDSLIGLLKYGGPNDNGTLFKFYGLNLSGEIISKKIFIKRGTILKPFTVPQISIAYLDRDFEDEKFGRVLAIRHYRINNENELPLDYRSDQFKLNTYKLKDKALENYSWKVVSALHVHHTYYQVNLPPWKYPSDSLQTLCWICHENLHKTQIVSYLDENGIEIGSLTPCLRCHGAGWFPEYKHIEEGVCFRCNGAKYEELIK